ncbi:MAG: hypothetical protein ACP5OZ_00430 [Candidatus Woesearchaeota archaeon]
MEIFQEQMLKANKHLKIADHMLYVTYPLLKDYKLMPLILENIFLALTNALSAMLNYELVFKRVPKFSDNFESKFNVFKEHCFSRYHFDKEILNIIAEVKELVLKHRKSPVEFYKNDKFVICSEDYKIIVLSIEEIKKYIAKTKVFIQETNNIISKHERIFKGGISGA